MKKLHYCCNLLGISPDSSIKEIKEVMNERIGQLHTLLENSDIDVRERIENDINRLLEIQQTLKKSPQGKGKHPNVKNRKSLIIKLKDETIGIMIHHYNLLDQLTKVIYPNGIKISYSYDSVGNRISLTYPHGDMVTYKYNPNNWLTELTTISGSTFFEYNKMGSLTKKILPNGITTIYTYNKAGRLIGLGITNVNKHSLFDFSYALDSIGNCLEIESTNNTVHYAYDPLYRLIKVKYPDCRTQKYKYDAIGNRLFKKETTFLGKGKIKQIIAKSAAILGLLGNKIGYSYDSEGHLIKARDSAFKYDNNGNLIEKKCKNQRTRFIYDADSNLKKIEYADNTYGKYTYDALGRRISKRNRNGKTTYFLYDGYNLILEFDDKGHDIARYVHDLGIDRPLCMHRNGKIYYYHLDHLGSVIALSNEKGEIVTEYEYDAWGNLTTENGDIENPFRFTGREWDKESGLYYYRTRYYDPGLGRFISKDPVDGNQINPQELNRYTYVNNNPQTYVDPFGLMAWDSNDNLFSYTDLLDFAKDSLIDIFSQGRFTPNQVWQPNGQMGFNFAGLSKTANLGKFLGDAGSVLSLTKLLPHYYNPDPLDQFTGLVHESMSIIGTMAVGGAASTFVALGLAAGAPVTVPVLIAGAFAGVVYGAVGGLIFNHLGRFLTNTTITQGQNIMNPIHNLLNTAQSALNNLNSTIHSGINTIQANVGGVLFDQAAEVLTDLEEITGAYWDDDLGQIVLLGKKNNKMESLYLPRMDKDHLAVAIRAVFSDDNLGVSIDPPPSYLESGKFPPDGTQMLVKYLGNTEGTLFGAIMFEADKLLKNLSMGIDNETGEEVSSQVADFRNELDLSLQYGTEKTSAWSRMWFVIENIRLQMPVKETPDRSGLCFGKASLRVKAEYLSQEKNPGVDPIAERFAKHFTVHFDDFAKEYPVLERLRELAKISAIAKYLKNSGKPVDLSFLDDHEFIKVDTPRNTSGITVSKSKSWQSGNTTHTQTYSLAGGVDFDFQYQAVKDDGEAASLKNTAQGHRPCETSSTWAFNFKGKSQKALPIAIAKKAGNYLGTHNDLAVPSDNGTSLKLDRCYDSFNNRPSVFGYGWHLMIPYRIFTVNPERSHSAIILLDNKTGKSHKYNFIKDKEAYYLVSEEKEENGKTSFTYNPQQLIKMNPDNSFTYCSEASLTYDFDSAGKLISEKDKNHISTTYTYKNDKVNEISTSCGENIRLFYDSNNRIKQVVGSDGKIVNYQYDPIGDLTRVTDEQGNIVVSYCYDSCHRLIKATNDKGDVILRNSYDPSGRVVRKSNDLVVDDFGNLINRTYDNNYQLVKEKDKQGNEISYEYHKQNLIKTIISDKSGRKSILECDEEERIKKITNAMGYSLGITYDTNGNITSLVDANGHIQDFGYDDNGSPTLFQDAMGNQWRQEFDENYRLLSVTDPMGGNIGFSYEDNKLVAIKTPEGLNRYRYDKKGNLDKSIDANGNSTEFKYDLRGRLTEVKDALGKVTRYVYDTSSNLSSIIDPDGKSYHYGG